MEPRIEILQEKKFVGFSAEMSFTDNKTHTLWRSFMPRRKEITNAIGTNLYSIQQYAKGINFQDFDPEALFIKWAAAEVTDHLSVPEGMDTLIITEGLYAVFLHKGSSNDNSTFQYIFSKWLPNSKYTLDDRPHFEILGPNYKNLDPSSEEEIWIPIK